MTEQKIEKIVIDKFQSALSASGIDDIQIMGAWQKSDGGEIKGLEDGTKVGVIVVKVLPRSYEMPTIPDGQFNVQVSLNMRADVDSTGTDYLNVTEIVSSVTHQWQKSFGDYATDFTMENEFQPTGYNLESGDVGLDRESGTWTFSQTFTLYGIIRF